MKCLKSMSDKWFDATCLSSLLLGIFMIKQCVAFNLIVLETFKRECDIKRSKTLSFIPLKNISVTIGLNFLLDDYICYHYSFLFLVVLQSCKFSQTSSIVNN